MLTRRLCLLTVLVLFGSLLAAPLLSVHAQEGEQKRGLVIKDNESQKSKFYESSYAVVVGVNEYQDSDIPGLNYAVDDAKSIQKMLINRFDYDEEHVTLLLNEEATKDRIKSALSKLRTIDKNSQVLFYFAGHGQTINLQDGGEMGALVAHDTKDEELYVTGLLMNELNDITHLINAKHQLFLVDACYGGLAASTTRGMSRSTKRYLSSILQAEAKQIITAGGAGEQVVEKAVWGHSAFAKVLLTGLGKGLADQDNNKVVTASELASFLRPKVNQYSDGQQTPVYRRFTPASGDFIFLTGDLQKQYEGKSQTRVTIASNVQNADIYVEGEKIGETPYSGNIQRGEVKLKVSKEQYLPYEKILQIDEATDSVMASLQRSASVSITSTPSGAKVYLDGSLKGKTPLDITGIVPKDYNLRLEKKGYPAVKKSLKLASTYQKDMAVNFKEYLGAVCVTGLEGEAEVKIVGEDESKQFEKLPVESDLLRPGTYRVVVEKQGFKSVEKRISLDGSTKRVNVANRLEPKSKLKSILLGLLVPGGGHFYMDRTWRGVVFAGLGSSSLGFTIKTAMTYQRRYNTYQQAAKEYETAETNHDEKFQRMKQTHEAWNAAKKKLLLGAGAFVGIKGLEVLDNLLFPSPKKQLRENKIIVKPTRQGMSMKVNF